MHTMFRSATVLALAVLLAGCSKLTAENYGRIQVGHSYAQVEALIGKPSRCDDLMGARNCTWGKDGGAKVNVSFVADKVVLFSAQNLR